jgi:hypothetical protein
MKKPLKIPYACSRWDVAILLAAWDIMAKMMLV